MRRGEEGVERVIVRAGVCVLSLSLSLVFVFARLRARLRVRSFVRRSLVQPSAYEGAADALGYRVRASERERERRQKFSWPRQPCRRGSCERAPGAYYCVAGATGLTASLLRSFFFNEKFSNLFFLIVAPNYPLDPSFSLSISLFSIDPLISLIFLLRSRDPSSRILRRSPLRFLTSATVRAAGFQEHRENLRSSLPVERQTSFTRDASRLLLLRSQHARLLRAHTVRRCNAPRTRARSNTHALALQSLGARDTRAGRRDVSPGSPRSTDDGSERAMGRSREQRARLRCVVSCPVPSRASTNRTRARWLLQSDRTRQWRSATVSLSLSPMMLLRDSLEQPAGAPRCCAVVHSVHVQTARAMLRLSFSLTVSLSIASRMSFALSLSPSL